MWENYLAKKKCKEKYGMICLEGIEKEFKKERGQTVSYTHLDVYKRQLLKSGKGFLLKKDNENLMLREEMREIIKNPAFVEQMGDAIEYRMTDYYRRRYKEKCNIDEPKIMV